MGYIAAGEDLTAEKLNAMFAMFFADFSDSQEVATSETTASTSYANLATVGPTVTLTSRGTVAYVFWTCQMSNATAANGAAMSYAISGATTLASSDTNAIGTNVGNTGFGFQASGFDIATINPGSNVYTCQYRVAVATTGTYAKRKLLVIAP